MKFLAIGDPHGVLPKKIPKEKFNFILITGDLGKADLARKLYLGKSVQDLFKIKNDPVLQKKVWTEINNSVVNVARNLSKKVPTYSIIGNVGQQTDAKIKKIEKKLHIKLLYLRRELKKIKNFHLVRNSVRNICRLRVGFLEYFKDVNWVEDFKPKSYEKEMKKAQRQTKKAERILKNFGKLDILVCHQPPYKILDEVSAEYAPDTWKGKHAGSKTILNYIKKYQPKFVFCGHIHEGKGKYKIGKTIIYNMGYGGDYLKLEI